MSVTQQALEERLGTITSDRPDEIRGQVVDAILDAVDAHVGLFFKTATDVDGVPYFTGGVFAGHDDSLIEDWLRTAVEQTAQDTPWLPPNTDPRIINRFVRTRAFYCDEYLLSFKVNRELIWPAEIGDQIRAVLFDGDRFLGWLGLFRRGMDERFSDRAERKLNSVIPQIQAALGAAEALESDIFADSICAVMSPDGTVEHASASFTKWLTEERQAYLKYRVVSADRGVTRSAKEIFSNTEVRLVRLDGPIGVRYLVTIDRAELIELDRTSWLTERQLEIAEYAVAGATGKEIADTLDLSYHTIKTHMKNIYDRLGISSRVELVNLFE